MASINRFLIVKGSNRFLIVKGSNVMVFDHVLSQKHTVQLTHDFYFTSDDIISIVEDIIRVAFTKGNYIWFEIASIELYDVTVKSRRERMNEAVKYKEDEAFTNLIKQMEDEVSKK